MRANGAPYNMAKSALEALALTMAKEEIGNGIRVNIAAPGLVVTDMGAKLVQAKLGVEDMTELDAVPAAGPRLPARRTWRASCASSSPTDADFVTGQRIVVDGGADASPTGSAGGRRVRARVTPFEGDPFAAFLGLRWEDEATDPADDPARAAQLGRPAAGPGRVRAGRLQHGRRRCTGLCRTASRWPPRTSRSTS